MTFEGVRRATAVAHAAWRLEQQRPKLPALTRDELEFLPVAAGLVHTSASRMGRAVLWTIMAFFAIAIGWACVGSVDVVAIARGKVVPLGRSKVIQPMETGVVKAITVQDGSRVKAGDVLVELDPTTTAADRNRLASELLMAQLEAARLKAMLDDGDAQRAFDPPADANPSLVEMNRSLLASRLAEYTAKQAALDEEIARKKADLGGVEADIVRLTKILPLSREQSEARTGLAARGYYSRLSALDAQQKVIEEEQELAMSRYKRQENLAAIASLGHQRSQNKAEFRQTALSQLADAEKQIVAATQDLAKATERNTRQTLRAPIDGVVQQLAIHTVGGVVTPAETLLVVAPIDAGLEVEATILNQDIGFVRTGQEAVMKLDAFPFTKYGTIPGRVLSVSRDAVQNETAQTPRAADQNQSPADKSAPGYSARLSLERTALNVDGHSTPLDAGMAVTVEIKTDKRRVIEYLLSPLLKYKNESLRER